jgi:transposase
VVVRQLRRSEVAKFFAKLPPCVIGLEACASAHYWARTLATLGHEVRLVPPSHVKPYVKRGRKNDAVDAAAICEAMQRPHMQFVPVKTEEQQAALMLHRARRLLMSQRTMLGNGLRSHFAEFGIIAPEGPAGLARLLALALDAPRRGPAGRRWPCWQRSGAIPRPRSRRWTMKSWGCGDSAFKFHTRRHLAVKCIVTVTLSP